MFSLCTKELSTASVLVQGQESHTIGVHVRNAGQRDRAAIAWHCGVWVHKVFKKWLHFWGWSHGINFSHRLSKRFQEGDLMYNCITCKWSRNTRVVAGCLLGYSNPSTWWSQHSCWAPQRQTFRRWSARCGALSEFVRFILPISTQHLFSPSWHILAQSQHPDLGSATDVQGSSGKGGTRTTCADWISHSNHKPQGQLFLRKKIEPDILVSLQYHCIS